MKISAEKMRDIAQELQGGMKTYINRETEEILSILDPDGIFFESEFWDEDLQKIENEWTDCVVIESMESWESFRIMENFIYEIDNKDFQQILITALERRRPFANFKAEVESSQYRQQWFDFRDKQYEAFVRDQLEQADIGIE